MLDRLQAEMQCALEGQTQTTSRAGGTDLMKLCLENGVHQVDLNRSQKRVTNEEYRAKQHGQEVLDKQNDVLKSTDRSRKKRILKQRKRRFGRRFWKRFQSDIRRKSFKKICRNNMESR